MPNRLTRIYHDLFSLDIGGTKLAAALVRDGKVTGRNQIPTPGSQKPDQLIAALATLLTPLVPQAKYLAIASTGIIDNGVLTALNPANLGGLNRFELVDEASRISGLPTLAINDAQAAAWAEYKALSGPVQNMAFVTVSTGVGAGIVLNGELQTGPRGIAGHAGHMLADPTGPRCGCGRTGCVEAIASGTAIGKAGQAIFGPDCSGQTLYQHALSGHRDAIAIVDRSARVIANLIADLRISLDLDLIALGGSVGLAEGYLDRVKHHLSTLPATYHTDIISAQCGPDAGLLGAADWAKQQHVS